MSLYVNNVKTFRSYNFQYMCYGKSCLEHSMQVSRSYSTQSRQFFAWMSQTAVYIQHAKLRKLLKMKKTEIRTTRRMNWNSTKLWYQWTRWSCKHAYACCVTQGCPDIYFLNSLYCWQLSGYMQTVQYWTSNLNYEATVNLNGTRNRRSFEWHHRTIATNWLSIDVSLIFFV